MRDDRCQKLLDEYAGLAMHAILASNLEPNLTSAQVAELAWDYAKQMLLNRPDATVLPPRMRQRLRGFG